MNQPDIRLSRNFYLHEFAVSEQFEDLADEIKFSGPDVAKAGLLAKLILQPIRKEFGLVVITSGKRSPELNAAVGGWELSHHLFLEDEAAADFTCPEAREMVDVYQWVLLNLPWNYGMLLLYPERNFIHVSLPCAKYWGVAKVKRQGNGTDQVTRPNRV
jgi:hypothetical protein